jgi:hypothetical protein
MPEVQGAEFESFRAERAELQVTYGRLGQAAARGDDAARHGMDEALTATVIMQIVESVIQLRRAGELRDGHGHQIVAACLRLAGLGPGEITRARTAVDDLLASLSVRATARDTGKQPGPRISRQAPG